MIMEFETNRQSSKNISQGIPISLHTARLIATEVLLRAERRRIEASAEEARFKLQC